MHVGVATSCASFQHCSCTHSPLWCTSCLNTQPNMADNHTYQQTALAPCSLACRCSSTSSGISGHVQRQQSGRRRAYEQTEGWPWTLRSTTTFDACAPGMRISTCPPQTTHVPPWIVTVTAERLCSCSSTTHAHKRVLKFVGAEPSAGAGFPSLQKQQQGLHRNTFSDNAQQSYQCQPEYDFRIDSSGMPLSRSPQKDDIPAATCIDAPGNTWAPLNRAHMSPPPTLTLEIPKSASLALPPTSRTFWGFRSRWTTPAVTKTNEEVCATTAASSRRGHQSCPGTGGAASPTCGVQNAESSCDVDGNLCAVFKHKTREAWHNGRYQRQHRMTFMLHHPAVPSC
jgi:hypothetical protein